MTEPFRSCCITYRSHLQGSTCPLKMEPIGSFETSILKEFTPRTQNTEEFSSTAAEAYDLAYL